MRQSLDTVGAVAGPLLAIALMSLFAGDFRMVFWVAAIPAAIAVVLVIAGVPEPERTADAPPISIRDFSRFDAAYWSIVAIAVLMTLARFSEAFLILKAHDVGLAIAFAPAVLVVMNLVYAGGAYPAGVAADRFSARTLLLAGLAALIAADALLVTATSLAATFAGIVLWGVHMALTQGLFAKLVADHAPDALRGSAFGLFNLATGLAMLAASIIAGVLWTAFGPEWTFVAGGIFALAAGAVACKRLT